MDQNRTPIVDALRDFAQKNRGYFNIPGHRGARGADERLLALLGAQAFEADRTETDGLDDLHAAEGVIREAQVLAAELFGSDHCRFVVNGTTGANEAMILAAVRPGEKILVPRSAHKSVLMGLVMSGAVPVWIVPEREKETGLYGAVKPEKVAEALENDPDIRAVFIVSPTYYGTCSDLESIAGIAHAHHIPLLADEAHGVHFSFHEKLPVSAIRAGADLVAQSTHKTVGSLTQSAMLHISGSRVSLSRVDDALKMVQSTSPSYLLMASLDGQRHLMAEKGRMLQESAMELAALLRGELRQIPGITVCHDPNARDMGAAAGKMQYDPCRVVFSACAAGMSGLEMQEQLFQYQITSELADHRFVVLVVTHGNTEEEIMRLSAAVREIAGNAAGQKEEIRYTGTETAEQDASDPAVRIPEMVLLPREAWFADKETVPLCRACGRIAGEAVTPYPPGIPAVYPGERLTEEFCRQMEAFRSCRIPVHDAADPGLKTVRVIK